MTYQIHRITINSTTEGVSNRIQMYPEDYTVRNLKDERNRLKTQYGADSIHFVYTAIPDYAIKNE
jgi:hypothetical protein